jgi:phospholipase/carboxylesterase
MNLLPHELIETGKNPTYSVIWLHGLGASGHDFVPIVPELKLPAEKAVRFIFPHAPERPVTVNGGYIMPSWYDIFSMELEREIDETQILASAAAVHQFIDRELERGVNSENVILAGFSQGGAVAYQAALTYPKRLGGLMAMSTYFATPTLCQQTEVNAQLPILIQHGTADSVVPELLGRQAHARLESGGWSSQYKTYPMDHEVCMPQVLDISTWLQQRFS